MATKDDLIIQRIEDLKDSNNNRLDSIDKNLFEHMARTRVSEKRLEIIEERLTVKAFLSMLVKVVVGIGSIAGSIFAIIKLTEIL